MSVAAGTPTSASPAVSELLKLTAEGASRETIEAAIDALPPSPGGASSTGRWKLEWTTEKEVLFLMESGSVTGVYQDLDVEAGRLENLVQFEDGFLRVSSSCSKDSTADANRVNFAFEGCTARWKGLEVPLPPYGSGWFENVYVDDTVRVSRDIRGDTQVVTRVGPSELLETPDEVESCEEAARILKRAAATKAVAPAPVLSSLVGLERKMREECKADRSLGEKQLGELDGAWRLVFTTGTLDTQARTGGQINYFPLKAVQQFDTKSQPMRIRNAIYAGETPLIAFSGNFEWLMPQRKLEFDFDRISLFGGALEFDLGKGKAAELGASSGLGSKGNANLVEKGKKPFFLWNYADEDIATARGGGGGIALWMRTNAPENSLEADA